jgi:hypothetical protein
MALARCPARHGQRSFRRMCQVFSWAMARSPADRSCVRAVGLFLRGGLIPSPVRGKDVVTGAVVALVGQLNRDELYVNLGCLRKCVQVAGI